MLHCSRRLLQVEQAESSRSTSPNVREQAKSEAWYLEDEADSVDVTPRKPVFTPYDPMHTRPEPSTQHIATPLPEQAPAYLEPLHSYLMESGLLVPSTVTFGQTAGGMAAEATTRLPEWLQTKKRKQDTISEIVAPGATQAHWDWVVVAEVMARGKGAVGRAERNVKEWVSSHSIPKMIESSFNSSILVVQLHYNPINSPSKAKDSSKRPRIRTTNDKDAEWVLIDAGNGVCINLMTREGRLKWNLEGAWRKRQPGEKSTRIDNQGFIGLSNEQEDY